MNYETIQNFLNTPISELIRDEAATEQAKENLKRYESFNELLSGKLDLLSECEKICSLELLDQLQQTSDMVDKNFIIGFKLGIKSLKDNYQKYQEAREYLYKRERN